MFSLDAPAPRTRPRPPWLRALGRHDPPETLTIAGERFRCREHFKHDAFAATAVYVGQNPTDTVVVKFGRTASAFGVPLSWLGAHLCHKERDVHRRLRGIAAVPEALDAPETSSRACRHTLVRRYVPGDTLRDTDPDRLADDFFADLGALLAEVHARGVAVMDLNKAENVLVDEAGQPHLIDFQLSVRRRGWTLFPGARWWLGVLQGCDRFYVAKHFSRAQPETFRQTHGDLDAMRPALTRGWRVISRFPRTLRRRLLVSLKIRRGKGTAETETAGAPRRREAHGL
ncbi:MAG: hypothetical protein AAF328_00600 [Planctomycetota bacterium]